MPVIINHKINILPNVECSIEGLNLKIKGIKGTNILSIANFISIENNEIIVKTENKALLKTRLTIIKNAMKGVLDGFEASVVLYGVGYKVVQIGKNLEFFLGYSNSIKISPPEGISFEIKSPTQIVLTGVSNVLLGDFVAKLTKLRKQNPYKLKGILKEGAFIKKKEGKK